MSDLFSSPLPPPGQGSAEPPYLAGLNPSQRQAVLSVDGPVLVLAGAGTGKTRVLTTRLAHLIATRRAWPSNILAVTFTNKAAREMRDRVAALVGPMAQDLWLGTFHALAARILRRHAELLGLRSNFTILDTDDQIRLIKQLLAAERIDDKRWPAKALLGAIERWKDRGLTPDKVTAAEAGDLAGGRLVGLYQAYQDRLRILNACDFGDLLLHGLTLFTKHPEVLDYWQEKFRYLLVDEYQDTNVAQYLWLRLLSQKSKNVCCVGDEDQSVYGWRGAEIENILRFEKDFPGATVIRLEQNYRSTAPILAAASQVIAHNQDRLGKTLWTAEQGGEPVRVRGVWDGDEEARLIAEEIEALQLKGHPLGQIAILVRAGFQTRAFEERLMTLGIPYRVIGGLRFYERAEVRDIIAYLRLIHQGDDDLAFERIVNTPRRGIGDATLQVLHRVARGEGISLTLAAARLTGTEELKPQARKALGRLLEDFSRWRVMSDGIGPGELAETVLEESGYTDMLRADKSPEAPGRLDNLKELVTALEEFDTLAAFLEHVSLVMERNDESPQEQVVVMTLHGAKGLEFDSVFLPGWEEGVFPNQRALDESGLKGLEEERRLAYVGLTRARKRAMVCYAANRRIHNQWQSSIPSRFVGEMPQDEIEHQTTGGMGRAVRQEEAWGGSSWGGNWGQSRGAVPVRRTAPVIEATAQRVQPRKSAAFERGQRVFHQKFGPGTVTQADGDRLEVAFDKAGTKKVIASFLEGVD